MEAFLWKPGIGMIGLGALSDYSSAAAGINDAGLVVGSSGEGITWDPIHGMLSLQYQLDASGNGWRIVNATAVNAGGQIVGAGRNPNGKAEAYLLTPVSGTDSDGDGYFLDNNNDCNDGVASIHPYAPEIRFDNTDQDCNGYDLTINITTATYSVRKGILTVEATSSLGQAADLRLKSPYTDYGFMTWNSKKKKWTYSYLSWVNPGTITVYGPEGLWTATIANVR